MYSAVPAFLLSTCFTMRLYLANLHPSNLLTPLRRLSHLSMIDVVDLLLLINGLHSVTQSMQRLPWGLLTSSYYIIFFSLRCTLIHPHQCSLHFGGHNLLFIPYVNYPHFCSICHGADERNKVNSNEMVMFLLNHPMYSVAIYLLRIVLSLSIYLRRRKRWRRGSQREE